MPTAIGLGEAWIRFHIEQQRAVGMDNPQTVAAMQFAFEAGWKAAQQNQFTITRTPQGPWWDDKKG